MGTPTVDEAAQNESDAARISPSGAPRLVSHVGPLAATRPRKLIVATTLFLVGLLVLWVFETAFNIPPFGLSGAPYFVYQAQSFLHGRWNLDLPPTLTDLIALHGKTYMVYPPMPAIVMMPFVAIFGLNTSDILITTVCSALNLTLLFLLLEQARENGFTRRVWIENVCISLLLWLGSISLWMSLGGLVWFTAHIVCMTFTLLALLAAFRRHHTLAAIFLGCAFFCRATEVFGYLFLFYLAWQNASTEPLLERFLASLRRQAPEWSTIPWRRLLGPASVTIGVFLLFMWRNAVVFGSPLDSGYTALIAQKNSAATGGVFNLSYVPSNFVANFFSFPVVTFANPFDHHPSLDMLNNHMAVSVFLTTPLFLYLFWRNQRFSATRTALWVTIILMTVSVLCFYANGYDQFGARYLFDAYPFAFLLLALTDVRVDWRFAALGYIGIVINILGAFQKLGGITPHV